MNKLVLTALLGLMAFPVLAQERMTNRHVLDLKDAGLGESIIRAKIESAPSVDFDMSTDALLELKKHGLSDQTVEMMIFRGEDSKKGLSEDIMVVTSIDDRGDVLVLNGHAEIHKGGDIKVFLPAFGSKEFVYVIEKKSGISFGTIARASGAVAQGAIAAGLGTYSVGALDVGLKAASVGYAADAIDQIQNLPISKSAKKIAGKTMEVLGWGADDEGFVVHAKLGRKKYNISIREAILMGEVKL